MKKTKKIMIVSYILILGILSLYINSVLKKEDMETYEKEKSNSEKEYQTKVTLRYFNGSDISEFEIKLKNTDTVEDLLQELRSSKKITYEITRYTYGIEISSVNGTPPTKGYKWAILFNGNDITPNIGDINLVKNGIYELKMIPK
ncbi:MAG TPA: hypothetical protein PKV39_00620 [bacterium]|jgi:hypothetical protein|nr:hypothetical protein [bacterium]